MKNLTLSRAFLVTMFMAVSSWAATDPESIFINVKGFWASANSDCSDAVKAIDEDLGSVNFAGNPDLGTGNLTNGTYTCFAIEMSDLIRFTPVADEGVCSQGTEYEIDVFHDGETSTCPDGTVYNGTTGTADDTCVYFSTVGAADPDSDAFNQPGFLLDNALVVSADTSMTFVVDFTGKITGTGQCDAQPPVWDFR